MGDLTQSWSGVTRLPPSGDLKDEQGPARLGAKGDAEPSRQTEWQVQDPEACSKELDMSRE